MAVNTDNELYEIRKELQKIINELDSIATGVRGDFSGIGNGRCADCVARVAEQYRTVRRKIDNIDKTKLSNEYIAAHGGGGGGSW